MPTEVTIVGPNGKPARTTSRGEFVVAPIAYDEVGNANMAAANTAYNLFEPRAGKQFVVTTILITAKKSVTTDEVVDIYEATSTSDTVIAKSIMQIEMLKSTARDFIGLRLLISEGAFVNGKADDAVTLVTMMGYFVDA